MTTVSENISTPAPVSFVARAIAAVFGTPEVRARRAEERRTIRELSMLTDRDLTDLGICRADIPFVARRSTI